jgi:hypothetical protein
VKSVGLSNGCVNFGNCIVVGHGFGLAALVSALAP